MKIPIIGPTMMPTLAATAHKNISHIRFPDVNMSSMLPATITVGIPDKKPVMKRASPMTTMEGTTATMTEKML